MDASISKRKNRLRSVLEEISKGVYEKEEAISLALLSALANESLFMIGPPGVGKSMVARRLKLIYEQSNAFEYLMNRFSTTDEIFGPISITKLSKEDKYERITKDYLPDATIVFLDEIWKAGPAIQNTLLTVLNERVYRNGDKTELIKMKAFIAASNELPEEGQGLEALWDRFLVRYEVSNIQDESLFYQMISDAEIQEPLVTNGFSDYELNQWSQLVDHIEMPKYILEALTNVRKLIHKHNVEAVNAEKIYVSDRRWKKMVRLMKYSAFLNDRESVSFSDCLLLSHCLWNKNDQFDLVKGWLLQVVGNIGLYEKFGLESAKQQIAQFDELGKRLTREEKMVKKDVPKLVDGEYYLLENSIFPHNRILADDFDILGHTVVPCRLYAASADFETYQISRLSNTELEVSMNGNKHNFRLRCVRKEAKTLIPKRCGSRELKSLEEKYRRLSVFFEHTQDEITFILNSEVDEHKGHLFLSNDLKSAYKLKVHSISAELEGMVSELKKMMKSYGESR
ncbi:AAA family ATPase [Aureibacter tunicatorum]|uniref:MoxR-like ATPase n=1 Tax=Aureibacter tunicatorum TaxID=866807 RepID=A0AAE3XLZ1_9BACT|nr:AAA family ATPase [Aureibacter tunicatorum]MDR6238925.1 MoxR-like ATPase [Aureibacter tunicatorum]BDD05148.1 hypothetical protein AUTU_26310 [Aureibacter tunicatorum]